MNNNEGIVYKDTYYEDFKGSKYEYIRETIHDSRQQGIGKSYRIIQQVIEEKDKNHVIIAPSHALLDEYCIHFENAEVEHVKLMGFKKTCSILRDKKNPDYEDVLNFYDVKKLFPYTICMLMGCKDSGNCQYKKQWSSIYDENRNICKTVLLPANLLPLIDFQEFSGEVFVDEVCDDVIFEFEYNRVNALKQFDKLKKYIDVLKHSKHPTMQYMSPEEYIEIRHALENKNVSALHKYKILIHESIYLHNKHLLEKYPSMKREIKANNLCTLRINEIIINLEFSHREKKLQPDERKWEWECKVEGGIRELAILDAGEQDSMTVVRKIEVIENLLSLGKCWNIESPYIDFQSVELGWDDEDFDFYGYLEQMKICTVPDVYCRPQIRKIDFQQYMMYNHLNSRTKIHFSDATFAQRKLLHVELIMSFKKLFPEYLCRCEVLTQHIKMDSTLWIPMRINCKFNKSNMEDDMQEHGKSIQNKITYLKKQGKKPCILTYKTCLRSSGTLFGCTAYYYGSAGGVNTYEEYDVLIVIGTHRPPEAWFEQQWNKYYGSKRGKMPALRWVVDEKERTSYPSDDTLKLIYLCLWIPKDIENLLHRVRPTRHNVDIYYYGYNVPEDMKRQMDVKYF